MYIPILKNKINPSVDAALLFLLFYIALALSSESFTCCRILYQIIK